MKKVRLAYGATAAAVTAAAVAPALALAPNAAHAATRLVSCSLAPHHWTVFSNGISRYCFGCNGGTWMNTTNESVGDLECGGNNYGWWWDSIYDGRLPPAFGIDNGQTAMPKAGMPSHPRAALVRSPLPHGSGHGFQREPFRGDVATQIDPPDNATHVLTSRQ